MASARASYARAVHAHREALGLLSTARERLDEVESRAGEPADAQQHLAVALRLRALASELAPDWLGDSWDELARLRPPTGRGAAPDRPVPVRLATVEPVPRVRFPVLAPLSGAGHLTIARDGRDPAVAGLLRGVLTRLLAAHPAGTLRILAVDGAALGAALAPFRALVPAGVMNEPVTDLAGLRNVLEEAEEQVRRVQSAGASAARGPDDVDTLLLTCAALPADCGRAELGRLAALAHAGAAARVHLLVAGWPPPVAPGDPEPPMLGHATHVGVRQGGGPPIFEVARVGPVELDPAPPADLVEELARQVAHRAESQGVLEFDDLVPVRLWQESSVTGVSTVIGRSGRSDAVLSLDDATPHWLMAGRTGAGKTTFLVDVLYGLAARYSADELVLNLLDFKEGVSFAEFLPSDGDPSWLPHAQAVGIESDRQYGTAVLAGLVREMNRRAEAMKRAQVTRLSQLRTSGSDTAMPRIVTVIDEFQVLFAAADETSRRATALLEEVARKGRSYGIHLILASQSLTGVEALFGKAQSIFGQFGVRIALSGGGEVLDPLNSAADALPVGQAVVNDAGGALLGNRRVRFPAADAQQVKELRHKIWDLRTPGSAPPTLFAGFAEHAVSDDPGYRRLRPLAAPRSARLAPVGRGVDVGLSSVGARLEASPGSHLAVLGTSGVGADVLHAATLGLSRQHEPGRATFLLADLVPAAADVVGALATELSKAGHHCDVLGAARYQSELPRLALSIEHRTVEDDAVYLVVFGQDAVSTAVRQIPPRAVRPALDDLRALLRDGPSAGFHVLGWWRGVRRLVDDLGHGGRDDVAWLMALNVRGADLAGLIGDYSLDWSPRRNRGLMIDRNSDTSRLVVPFVRRGRLAAEWSAAG